jgi:hypothetical protein
VDVYKIGIALSMSSNHAAVLSALSSHLLGVHAKVNNLTGGFSRLKFAIGGALSVAAGFTILDTMVKLVDKTKEYSDELVKLERLGGPMAAAVNSGAMAGRAFDISQRVPMKVTDLLKIPGATYSIIGEKESMAAWEDLAKLSWVLQSDKNYKGDPGKDVQALLRAGEMSGRFTDADGNIDIDRLKKFLDTSTRIIAATHGMVNPQSMLGMAKQGGFTLRGLSDEGYYSENIMAQAMGGPRAGTALLSLWQQMAGGTMLSRSAKGLEDIGLLKSNEWENDHGRVILGKEASQRLTKLIGKDPLDFAANIVGNLKERGITDQEEQMRYVMRALGRQTTQRYTAEMVNNFHQMLAERERMMGGMGAGESFGLINSKSVGANMEGLSNAWNNLLTAVAGPNSENVIKVLQSLTGVLNSMQKVVVGMDPSTITTLAAGIGALGLALTGGGAVALLAALGPAGWIAVGLGLLIAAAAKWGPDILKNVYAGLEGLADAANRFVQWLAGLIEKVKGLIGNSQLGIDPGGSFTSPGKTGKPAKKVMFEPGVGGMQAAPISLSLSIDGRTLARAVSDQQDALYRYETNSPAFNGSGRFGT